ncbi:MAG TPA: DUF192 domain-containing protein [Burkholderiales bacterium]|nr:DUF192 domain-containing protein [Burkholderiales bacterium]
MKRFLAATAFLLSWAVYAADTELVPLSIAGHPMIAEVANTPEAREQGLMFRKHLRGNHGMLFVFLQPGVHGMWMKNTSVPLSVAFLDEQGVIINIADMIPFSEEQHHAAAPAKFALEMPIEWFSKQGIKPGAKVEGLSQAPRGE